MSCWRLQLHWSASLASGSGRRTQPRPAQKVQRSQDPAGRRRHSAIRGWAARPGLRTPPAGPPPGCRHRVQQGQVLLYDRGGDTIAHTYILYRSAAV